MSPENTNIQEKKLTASSNVYAAMLALILAVVAATACYVAVKCFIEYGTIFTVGQ